MEKEEDIKKPKFMCFWQVFDLARKVKQLDVYTYKYKKFDKEEDLLEWLLDVLEEKQAGFKIEYDDTRDAAWQQEKEDRMRKDLHTNMADYKAKKLFFESNHFLSQPLQISLIQKDLCGKLNEDEEAKLRMRNLELKVELKQEKHPELCNQPLGKQLRLLHTWKKNKGKLQQRARWDDVITRETKMQHHACNQ